MNDNLWYKNAVFYELYPRAFYDSNGDGHGDLRGVIQKLDYLKDLGVDCIWLLPIYPSPLRDDGYDISDFTAIQKRYGSLEDFKALVQETHKRSMHLITDLVLNHTSDQHPWFQAARTDRASPYRDYYVWSDDDKKYTRTRIIFTDSQKSNWTWDEVAKQYFWHRFFPTQPDLNYDNPRVQEEMFAVMRFWLDLGVDGFRADAVPYLFEREGTSCENLPETHAFLKKIRRYIDEHYPGRILLCEANQWPADVHPYFGNGDEFHMGFHFPVMPRLFKALRKGEASDLIEVLRQTPPIPEDCQWCTFLRNHDELTLEMVSEEDRQWMWREYAPEPRMRLNQGIRRRLVPLLDNDRRKIELAYALLFALPGSPVLYYGDEIGMGDDITLDDRNGVRTPMQWTDEPNAGFSAAPAERLYNPVIHSPPYAPAQVNAAVQQAEGGSLFNALRRLIQLRKQYPAFGLGSSTSLECGNPAVFGCLRSWEGQNLLALHNLSGIPQTARLPSGDQTLSITLGAYGYTWLTLPQ
jgi:maltose alpha-D-glucosyltransferase/alpha-amylase